MRPPDAIAPDGSEIRLLVTDAARASLVQVTLAAGQASRPVRHRTVEEIWHITAGEGEVWRCPPTSKPSAAYPTPVRAGESIVIPSGWAFQFRAAGEQSLEFLCYTCPPWPGEQEAVPAEPGAWPATV